MENVPWPTPPFGGAATKALPLQLKLGGFPESSGLTLARRSNCRRGHLLAPAPLFYAENGPGRRADSGTRQESLGPDPQGRDASSRVKNCRTITPLSFTEHSGYRLPMTTSPPPQFALCELSIEDLDGGAQTTAEAEIRSLFELARRCATSPPKPVEISIELSANMAGAIDRFNKKYGIPSPPYDRSRPQGTSCGITLTVPGDGDVFRHVIVMDATLWSEQVPGNVVYRAYGLAHLLGHLINRHDDARVKLTPPEFEGEYAESLWQNALALGSTWNDCITAIDICNACVRDQDGTPVVLADYFGNQNLLAVSEILDQLCVFASFDVGFYRATAIGLEDLYPTAASLAGGLLRTVVETICMFAACGRFDELQDALSRMNGFNEFLEPIWADIINGCTSEEYQSKVQAFISAFIAVFDRLGLRIEDMQGGGLYVHVHEPVTCSWKEGEGTPD